VSVGLFPGCATVRQVLKYLVLNPNRVISRDDFLDQVWGYENYPCTRTVDNHILKLRQNLEAELAIPCTSERCMARVTNLLPSLPSLLEGGTN
jgi:DNA-binding SARP family transcriptional activator